ncbi:MAG: PBP1A family penicillin-binding protein [Firmicutes bacterium]|nr:PBP1A family penicillin-binding protein [Bacillota bacterium]
MAGRRTAFLMVVVLIASASALAGRMLPHPEGFQPALALPRVPNASEAYDINGRLIGSLTPEYRKEVDIDNVSPYLLDAIVSVEDIRFYKHPGIDPIAVGRALLIDLREGRIVEGGSTITQQTAKNVFLSQERTWKRKFKELYYALLLEHYYTKKEILELYINQIYFGHGAYGIESAARTFFNKSSSELSLPEAALLAGLTRSPAAYSPFNHPENAKHRRDVVLDRMVEAGRLDEGTARQAEAQPIEVVEGSRQVQPAAFVLQAVRDYLVNKYPDLSNQLMNAGIKVYTTIDLDMQQAAETAFYHGLADMPADLEGALVSVDPGNGYIKALVGGRNLNRAEFNRALEARRQPGSAMKAFLYTAAIDTGMTAASLIQCDPVYFPQPDGTVYQPMDYGDQPYHYRPFTLKEALMISDNVVAVKLNQQVGPPVMADYARRMGIKSPLRAYISLALGTSEVTPLEMAAAYCPLANGGVGVEPLLVLRVTGARGDIIEENFPKLRQSIDPQTAYIAADMLKGVLQPGGTASHLNRIVGRPAAGKTGTTNERRDAWFVGFTPDLSTAVYAGYDTPEKSVGVGGRVAGPIWAEFTREALKDIPPRDFTMPPGMVSLSICADTGWVAEPGCVRPILMVFRPGTEPGAFWWPPPTGQPGGAPAAPDKKLLLYMRTFPEWLPRSDRNLLPF